MEKNVPHGHQLKVFSRLKTTAGIFLILTTTLSISIAIINTNIDLKEEYEFLILINSIVILSYVIIEFIAYFIFSGAQIKKRLDNIDNAFGTSYLGNNSKGYFTNEGISVGIYKLGVNCFENCLFTYNISKRMQSKVITYNVILAMVFISTWLWGHKESALIIVQLLLPVVLIQYLIKLVTFVNRNKKILDSYYEIFSDLKTASDLNNFDAKIIRNILDYETNISWAVIKTSSRVYSKINQELSEEWKGIKSLFLIHENKMIGDK